MMCDAAVAAEEWAIAKDRVDEMVAMAEPDTGSGADDNDTVAAKVRGVTYRSCLALGRQTEYPDQVGRMALLAQALALCPADDVPAVLKLWRSVASRVSSDPAAVHAHALALTGGTASPPPSASAAAADRVLGSRTAARAASAAKWGLDNLRSLASTPASRAASGISPPASRGDTGSARVSLDEPRASIDSAGSGSGVGSAGWGTGGGQVAALFDDGEGVRKGARRALVKGVGWLLGAEDGEVESALAPSSE
jgi:hypothetical protein